MPDRAGRPQAAILNPAEARTRIVVGRREPPGALAPFVDYSWSVTWDLREPHTQVVIPRPVIHVSAEVVGTEPRLLTTGVMTSSFERVVRGRGRTVALAFLPAGFRPLLGSSVSALRDREVPLADLIGVDDRAIAARVLDPERSLEDASDDLARWFVELDPVEDPRVAELAALVLAAETDVSLTRAEHLADLAGVSLRTLQRHFVEHVGIGPKWVVQRGRLLDVASAAHADTPVDWSELADRLGYADQSHLIRVFTALVGCPPATYAGRSGAGPRSDRHRGDRRGRGL